jgi:hypothetical protein
MKELKKDKKDMEFHKVVKMLKTEPKFKNEVIETCSKSSNSQLNKCGLELVKKFNLDIANFPLLVEI